MQRDPGSAGDLAARRRSIQISLLACDYSRRLHRRQQRLVCRFLWRDAAEYNPDILDGLFYIFHISIWGKDLRRWEGPFKGRVCLKEVIACRTCLSPRSLPTCMNSTVHSPHTSDIFFSNQRRCNELSSDHGRSRNRPGGVEKWQKLSS